MEIQASIADIKGAQHGILQVAQSTKSINPSGLWPDGFTKVPSLNAAFAQHSTYWAGQPGDVLQAMQKYQADLQWAMNLLDSLGYAIDQQDKSSANVLDNFDVAKHAAGVGSFTCFQPRDNEGFKNLTYTSPVAVAEAEIELEALIAMFHDSDAAALESQSQWKTAATRLEATAHTLHSISSDLARNNRGRAFDEVRNALEDFVKRGNNISSNAALMAESVGKFPEVRTYNLAKLEALTSSNVFAGLNPAALATARKAAVKTFVSTSLQPSLEQLKPPVHNFGVPVIGHNGGGGANITSFASTGPAEAFQGINGQVAPASANNVQELGAKSTEAITDAGRGNAAANAPATSQTGPAAGENIPASQSAVNPAGAGQLAPASPATAPAGAQLPAQATANPAGMPGTASGQGAGGPALTPPTGAARPGGGTTANGTAGRGGLGDAARTGEAARTGRATGTAPRGTAVGMNPDIARERAGARALGPGASEPGINRQSPGAHGYGAPGTGANNGYQRGTVVRPELPAAHPENLRNGAAGRGLPGLGTPGTPNTSAPHTGLHGTGSGAANTGAPHAEHAAAAQNNQRGRGFYGGMAPGARGGAASGRQVKPGTGQWASSVSEYFKRQFLGAKPRTTKKVISR